MTNYQIARKVLNNICSRHFIKKKGCDSCPYHYDEHFCHIQAVLNNMVHEEKKNEL